MLQLLVSHPSVWTDELAEELLSDPRCRGAFSALAAGRKEGGSAPTPSPENAAWWSALLMEEKVFQDPAKELRKLLDRLKREAMKRELAVLQADVGRMLAGTLPRDEAKMARLRVLTNEIKSI